MRMVVDFPAPFGPMKPNTSPLRTSKLHPVHGDEIAEPARQIPGADGEFAGHAHAPLPRLGRGPR